jgi:hypothetical protein
MRQIPFLVALQWVVALSRSLAAEPWDDVVVWPLATGETVSQTYRVYVNEREVPVSRYQADGVARAIGVAHFAFSGTARVRITFPRDVPAGTIMSPRRLGLNQRVEGRVLCFDLQVPEKLAIHYGGVKGLELADGLSEKLFVFADSLEPEPPKRGAEGYVDAVQAGLPHQGGVFVAEAIQSLIDELPTGGTLRLGPGTYDLDRCIQMRSHRHVRVEAGALVRFTTRNPGGGGMFHFREVEHASLRGRGVLHLNGSKFRNNGAGFATCQAIRVEKSHHIHVEGLTLRDAGNINVFVTESCDNLFRDLKIFTDPDFSNTDGIGLNDQCARNVAEDLFVYNTDDSTATGWHDDMSHFTFRNVVAWNHGTGRALKVGTEVPGRHYRWFHFENIDVVFAPSIVEFTWEDEDGVPRSNDVKFEHFYVKSIRAESAPTHRTVQLCCGNARDMYFQNLVFAGPHGRAEGNGFRHEAWGGGRVWSGIEDVMFQHLVIGGHVIRSCAEAGFEFNPELQRVHFVAARLPEVNVRAQHVAVKPGHKAVFELSRTGATDTPLTLRFDQAGSAVVGRDFARTPPEISFAAGATQAVAEIETLPAARPGTTLFMSLVSEMTPQWTLGDSPKAQVTIHPEAADP